MLHRHSTLHAIPFLGTFAIVEPFKHTNQVAGDSTDALERGMSEVIGQIHKVTIHFDVNAQRLMTILFLCTLDAVQMAASFSLCHHIRFRQISQFALNALSRPSVYTILKLK